MPEMTGSRHGRDLPGSAPPRLVYVLGNFHSGGSERQAVEAARLLKESGHFDVSFACLDRSGPLLDTLRADGFAQPEEFILSSFARPSALRQAVRFARHLRRHRVQIVHCHEFYSNVFGLFSAALARVPVRVGARRNTGGGYASSRARRRLERLAFRTAHVVVTNASAVRENLVAEGVSARRTVVVPNAVDLEAFDARGESRLPDGLPPRTDHDPWITCVANMRHPVKDHETLLRAARLVADAHPGVVFVLAGEGELVPEYKRLTSELGMDGRVFFPGRIDDVASLLRASRLCVLSSRAEGMSNAILEYQAAGRPAVVTDVGAAREIVVDGETGRIVPPGDPRALADALAELLGDRKRAEEMGRRGRERVARLYSRQALAGHLIALYESLLEGTNS